MPLFQDFGKRFADAAKLVGKRTQDATEVVRLNGRMTGLQDEIERMFNQIGKAYYAMRNASGESEAALALCAKVDALQGELESVKAELDRIRNLKRCPNCGEVQAQAASFCANCGTKMPDAQPEPEPEWEAPAEEAPREAAHQPEVEINWPKPASRRESAGSEPSEPEPPEPKPEVSAPQPAAPDMPEPEPSEPEPSDNDAE